MISAFLEKLSDRNSKLKPVGVFCVLVKTSWMRFNFSNTESGRFSKLRILYAIVGLLEENLQKKEDTKAMSSIQITQISISHKSHWKD